MPRIRLLKRPLWGAAMLFVLSICGYPIDGLTQSTVLAINEVAKANQYVAQGYLAVGLSVVLLVWICAICIHRLSRATAVRDRFDAVRSGRNRSRRTERLIAAVNSGGR